MAGRQVLRSLNEAAVETRSKLNWDEEDIKFILVTWSEIRDQIGTKPHIKSKEKAYAYVSQ